MADINKKSKLETRNDFDKQVRDVLFKHTNMTDSVKEESRELTDQEIEEVTGGAKSDKWNGDVCNKCGHTGIDYNPNTGMYRCGKCGLKW